MDADKGNGGQLGRQSDGGRPTEDGCEAGGEEVFSIQSSAFWRALRLLGRTPPDCSFCAVIRLDIGLHGGYLGFVRRPLRIAYTDAR